MKLKEIVLILMIASMCSMSQHSFANEKEAWTALREGKAVAIIRHALAPEGGPESKLTRAECKSERNLSDAGRTQAVKIGELFKVNGITNPDIYSSTYCRCVDTATLLGYEEPMSLHAINAFELGSLNEQTQTKELTLWIKNAIEQQSVTNILITHGFNISALTQGFASQGDILIVGVEEKRIVTLAQINTSAF